MYNTEETRYVYRQREFDRYDSMRVFSESILFEVSSVHGKVSPQFVRSCESLWAVWPRADVGLLTGVSTHVGFEMVRSGELPLADFALEWPDARVFTAVSSQLVRSREPLATPFVVADIGLLSSVLSDVHLEMREFQVALGAAGVETHERFPLLFRLRDRHLRLSGGEHWAVLLMSNLGNDKGGVGGHGHLDGRGSLVHVSISGNTGCSIGHDLKRKCYVVLLLLALRLLRGSEMVMVRIRESENRISRSACHHHVLGHRWHGVVLERHGGAGRDTGHARHRGSGGCREIGELSVLVWLVGCADQVLGSGLWLHAEELLWGVDGRVVRTQLVIGHRGTGVRHMVGGRGELFVFQVARFGKTDEVRTSVIHESCVR